MSSQAIVIILDYWSYCALVHVIQIKCANVSCLRTAFHFDFNIISHHFSCFSILVSTNSSKVMVSHGKSKVLTLITMPWYFDCGDVWFLRVAAGCVFGCSLADGIIRSRLVEICKPCCLIFPLHATFAGTHRLSLTAWRKRHWRGLNLPASFLPPLSLSMPNLFPHGCSLHILHPFLQELN